MTLDTFILEDLIAEIMARDVLPYDQAEQIALHELFGEKDD